MRTSTRRSAIVHETPSFPSAARRAQRRDAEISPELLTARQTARLLGVSIRALHYKRDDLPAAIVLGPKCVRWRRADLIAFVEGLPAGNQARTEPPQLAAARHKRQISGDGKVTIPAQTAKAASTNGGGSPKEESNPQDRSAITRFSATKGAARPRSMKSSV